MAAKQNDALYDTQLGKPHYLWQHVIQDNDTLHERLICDTQHEWQHNNTLCAVPLIWVS